METGPRFIVPSDGLEKPGIEPATHGLQGECHNHCTTEAPRAFICCVGEKNALPCLENPRDSCYTRVVKFGTTSKKR